MAMTIICFRKQFWRCGGLAPSLAASRAASLINWSATQCHTWQILDIGMLTDKVTDEGSSGWKDVRVIQFLSSKPGQTRRELALVTKVHTRRDLATLFETWPW